MKIYFPLNLELPNLESKVYGWIDNSTQDIFICSFSNPKWFPEFNDIDIEECLELGNLSGNPAETAFKSIYLSKNSKYLNLNTFKYSNLSKNGSTVLIYYTICKELSKSADFSNHFSAFPLKQIKWAAILNFNSDGKFLKLTKIQKFLSSTVSSCLSLKSIDLFIKSTNKLSLRFLSTNYSSTIKQFFKKKDNLGNLYKFLLSNEASLSDSSRNLYRNNLILAASDLILSSILLPHLIFFFLPWIKKSFFKSFTIDFFNEYLDWFMGWPAGFKFNTNLTKFLGKFFLSLLAIWKVLIFPMLEIDSKFTNLLCYFKFFGLTFVIGIISDFWSISTLHILFFYRLMTRIYGFYCSLMISLFRLFRGMKWNVLRSRVDQTDYSMDQLLVGMLFFSILFCTFPTVTAYYLLFTTSLLFTLTIKCSLESFAIILNTFPVYFLVLKISKNSLFSNRFKLFPYDLKSKSPSFILFLESPKYSEIFHDFSAQIFNCWSSVFNLKNVRKIIVGYPIETAEILQ